MNKIKVNFCGNYYKLKVAKTQDIHYWIENIERYKVYRWED